MAEPRCEECPLGSAPRRVRVPGQFPKREAWNGLAVVGEQPYKEDIKARPPALFTGRSGQLARSTFKQAGLDFDASLVLSAISCGSGVEWPNTAEGKRQKALARECCQPWLEGVLAQWAPKGVLALGGEAVRSLTDDPKANVDGTRGTSMEYGAAWLLSTEHPGSVIRGLGFTADVFWLDVRKASRWLGQGGPDPWGVEVRMAPPVSELRELARRWRSLGMLSVDLETIPEPKNRWLCPLRTIGLGDHETAAVLPYMAHEVPRYYSRDEWLEVRRIVYELMADPRLGKLFHNMQFDIPVLTSHGFPVDGPRHDTMVAHHVLHQRGILHKLQYAASMYLDCPPWKTAFQKEWEAPFEALAEYNGRDVIVTARLWDRLVPELGRRSLLETYKLERWNAEDAWQQSEVGIWVDQYQRQKEIDGYSAKATDALVLVNEAGRIGDLQAELFESWERWGFDRWAGVNVKDLEQGAAPPFEEIRAACEHVAGLTFTTEDRNALEASERKLAELVDLELDVVTPDGRKIASRANNVVKSAVRRLRKAVHRVPFLALSAEGSMGLLLHDRLGFERAAPPNTDGTYQTNEHALHHLSKHPVVSAWWTWKSANKRLTWLKELPVFDDGFIHHTYKTTTTPSARYAGGKKKKEQLEAGESPLADRLECWNPQNVEKDLMRLLAAPPGHLLVAGDVKGAELRVAAALAGDPAMLRTIRDFDEGRCPYDLHTTRAISLWPDWADRPEKVRDLLRYIAKRANFLIIYGGGGERLRDIWKEAVEPEPTLAEQRARDEERLLECKRIISDVRRDWAVLDHWLRAGYAEALRTGLFRTGYATGCVMRFPLRDEEHVKFSQCFNYPIQRTTRELVVQASERIARRLPRGVRQSADNHDQLVYTAPEELVEVTREILEAEMNFPFMGVQIRTDILIGRTWKEVK